MVTSAYCMSLSEFSAAFDSATPMTVATGSAASVVICDVAVLSLAPRLMSP